MFFAIGANVLFLAGMAVIHVPIGNRAETGVGSLGGRDHENGYDEEEEQLDGHFAYLVDDGVCLAVLAAACKGGRGEMIACACVRIS